MGVVRRINLAFPNRYRLLEILTTRAADYNALLLMAVFFARARASQWVVFICIGITKFASPRRVSNIAQNQRRRALRLAMRQR